MKPGTLKPEELTTTVMSEDFITLIGVSSPPAQQKNQSPGQAEGLSLVEITGRQSKQFSIHSNRFAKHMPFY